jgi:metallophosphoesterase (TIGR00282 family)
LRILFLGDVVGRSGRDAVVKWLPALKAGQKIDFCVVNGENAAAGFGMTPSIVQDFLAAGADVVTSGDHVWDQRDLVSALAKEKRLLRAVNFPPNTPGRGVGVYETENGKQVAVVHVMGQVFMREALDNPFAAMDTVLEQYRLGKNVAAIIVDIHAEATSEKCAMGCYLDGRVSLVVGSHTHIPTSDTRILPGGTGYQTDAGMCGDYDSVIGFAKQGPIASFTTKMRNGRFQPADGPATLCGVIVQTNDTTGLATSITPLRMGGVLQSTQTS